MPTTVLNQQVQSNHFHGICHFINCRDDCCRCSQHLTREQETKYAGPVGQKLLSALESGNGHQSNIVFVSYGGGCEIGGGPGGYDEGCSF